MNDSISVIIPTCNRAHVLPRALDSVLAQTRPPQEIIVVDDGSSDDTAELVRSRYPSVSYLYQPNAGVSSARNRGVEFSRGHWLAFLDSDDEWLPGKLQQQIAVLQTTPGQQLCHTDEIWIRNGRRVNPKHRHAKEGGRIFEKCLPLCAISPSSVVIGRELFSELGGFDESLPACEDYDLWLRICARHSVLYIDEALLRKYGGHEDQLSKQHWGMDRFRVAALEKLLASEVLNDRQAAAARETLLAKCEILANGALKRGRVERVHYYRRKIASHSSGHTEHQPG